MCIPHYTVGDALPSSLAVDT